MGLKANIKYFKKYPKVDNHVKANTHSLKPLQAAFKDHILKTIENLKNEHGVIVDKAEINELNNYFTKLDGKNVSVSNFIIVWVLKEARTIIKSLNRLLSKCGEPCQILFRK